MKRYAMLAVGLALVAGCAEPPPVVDVSLPPQPLPGETFPDPEDTDVEACLTVVSLYTRSPGLVATGKATGPEGSSVSVAGDQGRWRCQLDADGRVTAMLPV